MLRASAVADAARLHVEHRVFVELADRRAVRALHVVRENLELRLRVDLRVVREQQRLVRLLRVRLLRVLTDDDLAVEDRAGLAGQDALVELVARAVRHRVVDRRVRVDERVAAGHIQAVERAFRALARQRRRSMSLRAMRPPSVTACDRNVAARSTRANIVARWNVVGCSRWNLT